MNRMNRMDRIFDVVACHCDPVLDAGVCNLVAENVTGSLTLAAGDVAPGAISRFCS